MRQGPDAEGEVRAAARRTRPGPRSAAAPAPAAPKVIALSAKSLFAFDKAVLTAEGRDAVDKEVLSRIGEFETVTSVIVSGHTDRWDRPPTTRSCPSAAPKPSRPIS